MSEQLLTIGVHLCPVGDVEQARAFAFQAALSQGLRLDYGLLKMLFANFLTFIYSFNLYSALSTGAQNYD